MNKTFVGCTFNDCNIQLLPPSSTNSDVNSKIYYNCHFTACTFSFAPQSISQNDNYYDKQPQFTKSTEINKHNNLKIQSMMKTKIIHNNKIKKYDNNNNTNNNNNLKPKCIMQNKVITVLKDNNYNEHDNPNDLNIHSISPIISNINHNNKQNKNYSVNALLIPSSSKTNKYQ